MTQQTSIDVIIDGVKYLPAETVLANSDDVMRALVALFWGEGDQPRNIADELWIVVEEEQPNMPTPITVREFAHHLAERLVTT